MSRPSQRAEPAAPDTPRLPPRRAYRPWVTRTLLIAAFVVGVDALVGDSGLAQTVRARRDFRRASLELARLRGHNAALRRQIDRLQHDRAVIEDLARGELGFVRPGEILVILNDVDTSAAKPNPTGR